MSRYFNDFDAMNLQGGVIAHKAHKYIKKVKTKSGKTRYVYAKTVGSVGKNIATNPRKYGSAHAEELTPEELRRFSGKAHAEELWLDKVPQERGVAVKNMVIDPTREEITFYDNRYGVGRKGKKFTLSARNGELDKNANFTERGNNKLIKSNAEIAEWHNQQDQAKAKKRYKNTEKRTKKEMAKMKKQMKKMGGF